MLKVILPPPRPSESGWTSRPHWRRKIKQGVALVGDGLADAGRALWHGAAGGLGALRERGASFAGALGSRAGMLSRTLVPKLARRLHL